MKNNNIHILHINNYHELPSKKNDLLSITDPGPAVLIPRAPSERCVSVGEKDCSTAPMRRSWAQDKAGISRCSSAQSCMAYRISPFFFNCWNED